MLVKQGKANSLATAGIMLIWFSACSGSEVDRTEIELGYHEQSRQILVRISRPLATGESLHVRARQGALGELDCQSQVNEIPRIDQNVLAFGTTPTYRGPEVDESMFADPYDADFLLSEPDADTLAELAAAQHTIDVCIMHGSTVVKGAEFDIRRALDRVIGSDGKFDGENVEERIESSVAYAEACVAELGEIPFFSRIADGDYTTYNCLDATPIPTTVTDNDGTVEYPTSTVSQCDNPQYIYSLCEPSAVTVENGHTIDRRGSVNGPRVTTVTNEQGTSWVLLCRKARNEEGAYNDIAMIGHNPASGQTCYFQNALYSLTDGLHVPHPADRVQSENSPQQSESLWKGIQGGIVGPGGRSNIQCVRCHDNDPFIHTPWIDQAVDENGDPIVPRMGVHENFPLGFNDAPYTVVNLEGQGWLMPKHITSEEASPCTRCHRIGNGRWSSGSTWLERLRGTDAAWTGITTEAYRQFEHTFWMPPDLEGLTEQQWPDSPYAHAMQFILDCGRNPNGEGCEWSELPKDPIADLGELPTISLRGEALAVEALRILGADFNHANCPGGVCGDRRCSDCHAISRGSLSRWHNLTTEAVDVCNLDRDPDEMSPEQARQSVDCMRLDPANPQSVFSADRLGLLATGVQYNYFRRLFRRAYGEDDWLMPYTSFRARVMMPKGNHPQLTQREYAVLRTWIDRDLEDLEVLPLPPAPTTCEPSLNVEALTAHVEAMRLDGWGAINAENGIQMLGCATNDPRQCFTTGNYLDRSAEWGNEIGTIRQLTKLSFSTSYWTRTSPDGRYVGNGGGSHGSTITDLLTGRDIGVEAAYDPGFFPDNSGFIFQGAEGGSGLCDLLALNGDTVIDFTEPRCSIAGEISNYQHVARALSGGDYFVINSQYTSDFGNGSSDPVADFGASASMTFIPMLTNGTTSDRRPAIRVDSPFEGDSVLSPSGLLVASRLAGAAEAPLGYVVRRVDAQRAGNSYRVDIDERLATICFQGGKPNFSFDERFMVTHHYHSNGSADIYLIDLLSGYAPRLTRVPEGTHAVFPHFRSDDWIYFLVKTEDDEFIAASDAAVQIRLYEEENP